MVQAEEVTYYALAEALAAGDSNQGGTGDDVCGLAALAARVNPGDALHDVGQVTKADGLLLGCSRSLRFRQ